MVFCVIIYMCFTVCIPQKLYAKAVYENIAESPDELAFKRGDVLSVIEQDTDGLTGWWLCSLRERTVTTTNI